MKRACDIGEEIQFELKILLLFAAKLSVSIKLIVLLLVCEGLDTKICIPLQAVGSLNY
jgi:hypothetical protein